MQCLLNLFDIYNIGNIFSSCFFNYNNINYILTSNGQLDNIKMLSLSGKIYQSIQNTLSSSCFFVNHFYDQKQLKYYIIMGHMNFVTSYDFDEKQLYKQYKDDGNGWHAYVKVFHDGDIIKLLDSCWEDDYLRIWDFHSGILLNKIKTEGKHIKCIFIFNNNYIFVGCANHSIKLIDTRINKVISNLVVDTEWVTNVKKIFLPNYGTCVFSQGSGEKETIKMWRLF